MQIFFSYILLGISLAAPIGPINAAQLDRGIRKGFFHAWMIGLGAVVADGVYMLIVYMGFVHIIDSPFIKTFLWLFGCFVLLYTGIECIVSRKQVTTDDSRETEPAYQSFLSGFVISITNPLTILFWLGIYGSVLANTASAYGREDLFLYSSAIFIGLFIWDISMAAVSSGFRRFFDRNILSSISIISGLVMIGFGLYFAHRESGYFCNLMERATPPVEG